MRLIPFIINEIMVVEIRVIDGSTSTKLSVAKHSNKTNGIILQEMEGWIKKTSGIAILFIYGNDIGSKNYDIINSDDIKKITKNENLIWTIHDNDSTPRIDFTRKTSLKNVLKEIETENIYILDINVSSQMDLNINTAVQNLYDSKFNFSLVRESKEFRALFFNTLFNKTKLPVLLLFFILLLANYILFFNIKEKYDLSETTYNIQLQETKTSTEDTERANRLFEKYDKIQYNSLALISDRIASYIPKDTKLTSMTFFPENKINSIEKVSEGIKNVIVVKGKSEIAGTVLLFAQHLQEDKLFSKVDVISINNIIDTSSYNFELHITL